MLGLGEEDGEGLLEQVQHLNANCQHQHGHYEGPEGTLVLAPGLALDVLDDFGDFKEDLLQVKLIQRQRINMPKHSPVRQMTDQTNQARRVLLLDFLESSLYVSYGQGRRACDQEVGLDIL